MNMLALKLTKTCQNFVHNNAFALSFLLPPKYQTNALSGEYSISHQNKFDTFYSTNNSKDPSRRKSQEEEIMENIIRDFKAKLKGLQNNNPDLSNKSNNDKGKGSSNTNNNNKSDKNVWWDKLLAVIITIYVSEAIFSYIYRKNLNSKVKNWITLDDLGHSLSRGEVEKIYFVDSTMGLGSGGFFFVKYFGKSDAELDRISVRVKYSEFSDWLTQTESELKIKPSERLPVVAVKRETFQFMIVSFFVYPLILSILRSRVSIQQVSKPTKGSGLPGMGGGFPFMDSFSSTFKRAEDYSGTKGVTFKEVGGLHAAKQEMQEFVAYIKSPQRFLDLGAKLPKGALLLGPPGCGKTLLVKALANEAKVPIKSVAASEFVEVVGGLGAKRVRELFEQGKKNAPCIIFIDEIDTVGRKRMGEGSQSNAEEEHTLNQLLVEMDGMQNRSGIIVFAATNREDLLDRALVRPGRFDRQIMIDLPTKAERKDIFLMYLKQYQCDSEVWDMREELSNLTPGMTGADIANICNEAALDAASHAQDVIKPHNFHLALEKSLLGTVVQKSRVLSQYERRSVAYHEAGHALMSWLLPEAEKLIKVSVIPRSKSMLGFTQYNNATERHFLTKSQYFAKMCTLLGGRVAEVIAFNPQNVSTNAQNDLKFVTDMAVFQVRQLGFSPLLSHISFDPNASLKPYSNHTQHLIDREVERFIREAIVKTQETLTQHRAKLDALAVALLERETLFVEDVEKILLDI